MLNALGCSSFHGTISATIVLMIPTFPFPAPANARIVIAIGTEVENPQTILVIIVFVMPSRMVGFRPSRSDAHPQGIAVTHWQSEKTAAVMPAHFATSAFGTLNDSIISGR